MECLIIGGPNIAYLQEAWLPSPDELHYSKRASRRRLSRKIAMEGRSNRGLKRISEEEASERRQRAKSSPVRQKWFAAGNGCSETVNYYVEPQVGELVERLQQRSYCVLTGVRQSGKSTIALHVRKVLRASGYECIYLDLPPHLPSASVSDARRWEILVTAISRRSDIVRVQSEDAEVSDATFSEMFSKKHMDRDVILIFDEMNTFGRLPASFKDSFLATLRAMKLDRESYCLHSILLIGTASILSELKIARQKGWATSSDGCTSRTGFEYSPFSHDFKTEPSFFSVVDIEDLLAQYEEDRLIEVETAAIAKSIFDLTSGHKGLVGVCCAELDAAFKEKSRRTLQMWEKFVKTDLGNYAFVKPTYFAMVSMCRCLNSKGMDLILQLLRAEGNVTVHCDRDVEILIAEGVVVDNSPEAELYELSISSALLHSELLKSLQVQLSIKIEPGPTDFDHLWVLTKTIERLDWSIFGLSESQNSDHMASEYSIQFEFFTKLKAVLLGGYSASRWLVIPEAKSPLNKRKRLDILVRDGIKDRWFAVELLRQGSLSSLREHYERAKLYAAMYDCVVYMLNFVLKEDPDTASFNPSPGGDVFSFNVFGGTFARIVGGYTGDAGFLERPLNLVEDVGKLSLFSDATS